MPKLTKTVVEGAEPRDKQYVVWCSELRGFGVSINTKGSRSYVVDYRNAEGIRRRMTLGRHGVLTAEEARKQAIRTLGSTVSGEDPQNERRTRRSSLTIKQLCDDYVEACESGLILGKGGRPKKASTIATDKGRIDKHIKPLIGNKLVIDLKRPDVMKFMRDVTTGATRAVGKSGKLRGRINVTGGAGTAARSVGVLGSMLSFAINEGVIETNPAHGIKKPPTNRRTRRLTPDEFKAFAKALDASEMNAGAWQGVAILRFVALSGCRLGEAVGLKWSEVDLENQVLKLDDSKTGASIRPLGRPAVEVLTAIKATDGTDYVFPASRLKGEPYAGIKRFYRDLFAAAGFDDVTPHVLRHSFASVGSDLNFTDTTIGACLGHAAHGITSRYTHRLDAVLIAAANKIASEVDRQMIGAKGNVVSLPRQA